MQKPYILGINFGGHDTSAALMAGGQLVAACAQERYDLVKHSRAFPIDAIRGCLSIASIDITQVDLVTYSNDNNLLIRERYLRPALTSDSRLEFMFNDIDQLIAFNNIEDMIKDQTGFQGEIRQYRHHSCHLASTYFPSGFDECLLVSYDGMGEWETGLIGLGKNGQITIKDESNCFPDSLGLVYSAITHYLGWRHHCDEGIVMGLAPYGNPAELIPGSDRSYISLLDEMIVEHDRYSYHVDRSWVTYHERRNKWVSDKFINLMGPSREPESEVLPHHMNLASALQKRLETLVLGQLRQARNEFGFSRLALSGGVALNCSLNGKIEASGLFDEIYVAPGSGDEGLAIGSCFLGHNELIGGLKPEKHNNYYLGYRASDKELVDAVKNSGLNHSKPLDLFKLTAQHLVDGKIVAWFQGSAEFGPRALGNRSILARPFPTEIKDHINARVKFREYFRPFAGAILEEHREDYFKISQPSPHMLIACQALPDKQEEIPAVCHVDGSCRIQSVNPHDNPEFFQLIQAFYLASGIPIILNTSFNIKGQPIVNTPVQAIETFKNTMIDCLVLGDYLFEKRDDQMSVN